MPFEEAVELVFHCANCSKPLVHFANEKMVVELSGKVDVLRKELGE